MARFRRTVGGSPTSRTIGRTPMYVRPFVPPPYHGGHSPGADWRASRQVSAAGGIYPAVAARRQGTLLPKPSGRDDGGADHRHRGRVRTGRANRALSTRMVGGGEDAAQAQAVQRLPPTGAFSSTRNWTPSPRQSHCCRTGIPKPRNSFAKITPHWSACGERLPLSDVGRRCAVWTKPLARRTLRVRRARPARVELGSQERL